MQQKTLVLDLDGTLVDSVPDLAAALNRLMASRNLPEFTRPEVAAMVGDGAKTMLARAFAARNTAPDDQALPDFLADYGANAAIETRPYPGVPETLESLAASGWRLAVCTNKPIAPARALLAALNLAHHFAAIAGGDSYPVKKPDPAHLLATLAEANAPPETAIMAGDHHNDIAAAHGAGLPAIFCTWGYGADPGTAEFIAHRFADIPTILSKQSLF